MSAAVLAGGMSRWMGTPKALLRRGERTILEDKVALLKKFFKEVVVVEEDEGLFSGLGVEVLKDFIPGLGPLAGLHAALLPSSTFAGKRKETSGKIIMEKLKTYPVAVSEYKILLDEKELITAEMRRLAAEEKLDIILTTGGTGHGPRDKTPEATLAVVEKMVPGIAEVMRHFEQRRTPLAMLSRGLAGIRGNTLIANLPRSSKGAGGSRDSLFPGLLHGLKMFQGEGHTNPCHPRS